MTELESYVSNGHLTVEGWFGGDALTFFTHANVLQKQLEITGSVAEIGIHHGRLFILLLLLKSAQEHSVAIDVFGLQHLNYDQSGSGSRDSFLNNVKRHAPNATNLQIIEADSMQVFPSQLLEAVGNQRVRMFSIDGSHTAHCTASDLRLAHEVIAPGGIITIDDYFNGGYPMVAEGVARFMLLSPFVNIAPVMAGANKIVFTTKSHHAQYLEHYKKMPTNGTLSVREFYGYPCVCY